MRSRWGLALVLAAAVALSPAAAAKEYLAVYFVTHKCKDKLEPGTPGSAPDRPLEVEDFEEVYDAAVAVKKDDSGAPTPPSKFECRWVRLTGFFAWSNYYHYRGEFHGGPWRASAGDKTKYWIERFRDPAERRVKVTQREVTITGRFYDLCAAAGREEAASGDDWGMRFGPCHYGANNGMMLTDVVVEKVHDEAPRYVLGESNRKFFKGNLEHVEAPDRDQLIDRTRAWAAAVQRW